MTLSLNHFSIRTTDLEASRHFYEDVLGLAVGPRPPFAFPGLWLYAGTLDDYSHAVVHIIGIDQKDPEGLKRYLGDRDPQELKGTGVVDHVAFFAQGLPRMIGHLQSHGLEFRERSVPVLGLHQIFVTDPNGVVVELNFPATEAADLSETPA
jgi:catechol 2,3-dioxygenase-like lactoylglutathione lyase family enzyme